jgi:glycogen debranching enzyme
MRTSTMVLKQAGIFVVSDERGDIGRGTPGAGIYFRDTRFLSDFHLTLNGEVPEMLDSSAEYNVAAIIQFANPCLQVSEGRDLLPQSVSLRRYRLVVDQGVLEQLDFHNFNDFPVTVDLELTFGADYRDIFDVRGFRRSKQGRILLPRPIEDRLILGYRAPDGAVLETVIKFNRPPDAITIEAGAAYTSELEEMRTLLPGYDRVVRARRTERSPRAVVLFRVSLSPGQGTRIELHLSPGSLIQENGNTGDRYKLTPEYEAPTVERFAGVTTSNDLFNGVLDRSLRDLRTLITPFPGGRLVAAGIPWYVAPFGRDSIITSLQTLMFSPDLTTETLRFLARHQGTHVDTWTESQPGKILHEQRFGEMARLGEIPHVPYYGTVDATPLFIILFCELMSWVGTQELFNDFLPYVESALNWIDRYSDSDGDGFSDYGSHAISQRGLTNQGWKDSDNSLQFPDHSPIATPIALVEVQGYVYQAKQLLAGILERYGNPLRAEELRRQAEDLRQRFEARFWSDEIQFYGQAIDGSTRLVPAISSNPGHALYSGIISPERAEAVVRRLCAEDMYSGWGIRTLSTAMPHYNPMSYHNGSVWPHDNSLIVAGFRHYGFEQEADRVITDMLDAAKHFKYNRLPELFCGFSREFERYTIPISYPVSCSPQSWAAGAIPFMLEALLGIEPDAMNRRLELHPYLPDWLPEVQIRRLRFADRTLDLTVRGHGKDVELSHNAGDDIQVVLVGRPKAEAVSVPKDALKNQE